MRGFLRANYEDGNSSTFTGFEVHISFFNSTQYVEDAKILFNTGDPIYDFYAYKRWMLNSDLSVITHSSSVDHFFMDSDYLQRYVKFNDEFTDGDLLDYKEVLERGLDSNKLATVMCLDKHKMFSEIVSYIKEKQLKEGIVVNKDFTISLKENK